MLYSCTHMVTVRVKGLSIRSTYRKGALSFDGVHLSVCLSVCRQHRRLTCIRQRAPLLVMMQQSLAMGAVAYRLDPSGRYTCYIGKSIMDAGYKNALVLNASPHSHD